MSEQFLRLHSPQKISDDFALNPMTIDAKRLAELLGVGLRSIRTWDVSGKLPAPIRIGSRVLWRMDEIKAWINADCPDRKTWMARRAAVRL